LILQNARSAQVRSIALVLVSLLGLLCILNMISGLSLLTSVESAGIITIEGLAGLVIYLKCFQERGNFFEGIGFAIAGGGLLAALSDQLFLLISPINIGWLLPSAVAVLAVLLSKSGATEIRFPDIRELLAFSALLVLGCLMVAAFWKQNPLHWVGWWQHYGDLYFHEGVARSVAESGLDHNNWLEGYGLGYHWFGESWMGHFFRLISIEHFATTSRLIYTSAILGSAGLAYGWARRMSSISWAPLAAITVFSTATLVAVSVGNTYGMLQGLYSPTHTFALLSLLALSVSLTKALDGRFIRSSLIPVLIFSIGTGGGRITQALVAGGGLGFLTLWLIVRKSLSQSHLAILITASFGLSIGLVLAIRPWAQVIRWNQFEFYPNTQFASMLGLVPLNGPLGGVLGALSTFFVLLPGLSGLLWMIYARRLNAIIVWTAGCLVAGIAAAFLTFQVGFSHMTFIFSGVAVALIPAGVGLASAIQELRSGVSNRHHGWRLPVLVSLIGVVSGFAVLTTYSWATGKRFEGPIHWLTPILLLTVAVALGILIARLSKSTNLTRTTLAICVVLLSFSAMSSGFSAALIKWSSDTQNSSESSSLSLSPSDLAAADWITQNIPRLGLFATNRLCSDPTLAPPSCQSSWLKASVLTGRPVLIEGYSNGTGASLVPQTPENSWILQRILPSWNFALKPTLSDSQQLWDQGVRWFWVDKLQTSVRDWEPFAETVFENDSAAVLRLRNP
jgi:hypothetical protein